MSKLIGLTFLAILIGTTVVAGPRLTGSETRAGHPFDSDGRILPRRGALEDGCPIAAGAENRRQVVRLYGQRLSRSGYTGSASISTKAMQHGCSVRLLQA